jgi:hypothetical protein
MHTTILPFFDYFEGNVRESDFGGQYEEIQREGVPVQIDYRKAPTPPRQSDLAPIKQSRINPVFFYQPVAQDGGRRPFGIGPSGGGAFRGWHTTIAPGNGTGSWTSSPRGILRAFGTRRNVRRNDPSSYGDLQEEI